MALPLLPFLLLAAGAFIFFHAARSIHAHLTCPLRNLPGPDRGDRVFGHFKLLINDYDLTNRWRATFGTNFVYRGLFNKRELYTADLSALKHILVNDMIYQKPPPMRQTMESLVGNGLTVVEGEEHRRQRKILNPAFSIPATRDLTQIFTQKSVQLRDLWLQQLGDADSQRIDAFAWLRKMTLEVIAEAGFNYHLNALEPSGPPNELVQALEKLIVRETPRETAFRFAQASIPVLRLFPTGVGKAVPAARAEMFRIGARLLAESKAAAAADLNLFGGKKAARRRDLLSVMVQSNMLDNESVRISDTDVIAQIPANFTAGHDTSSTSSAWLLHALSLNKACQTKLRQELLTVHTDNPSMDELNSLPYLDWVIREAMRAYTPVATTFRVAMQDDVLPLSKPYVDRHGVVRDTIPLRKGTLIRVPIEAVHLDKDIWGPDAQEFKPERWECIPEAAKNIPSAWGNLLTFLAGPRNCIASRFSVVEMKSLLFTLVRAFEIDAAVPAGEIIPTASALHRPRVRSELGKGAQLPLVLRRYVPVDEY
ncbi:cytochrome P450 [Mycena maculata]|uniref:Cytochrome P450 n=1 Tax=Mycena maculata TaxID=230809 RepID=A0AAD7NX21_9AGAR|nr:cytochrome P450 [Mycena maculata]